MNGHAIRAIVFDVVGTLLYPEPSVSAAYASAGARWGSRLEPAEVQHRFRAAFARHFARPDEITNDAVERSRWLDVVSSVFANDVSDDQLPALFDSLWRHFAEPRHWRIFADVAPAWSRLEAAGYKLVLGSNFDQRLLSLVAGHEPLRRAAHVFPSSLVGYCKPSPRYFAHVAERLGLAPQEILMVGDDVENDYHGPRAAGWQALWLDRAGVATGPDVIRDLTKVAEIVLNPADLV